MYPKPSTSHHSAAIIVPWDKHAGETVFSIDNGGDRAYVEYTAHLWLGARLRECQVGSDRVPRKLPGQNRVKPR